MGDDDLEARLDALRQKLARIKSYDDLDPEELILAAENGLYDPKKHFDPSQDYHMTADDRQIASVLRKKGHKYAPWIDTIEDMMGIVIDEAKQHDDACYILHASCITGSACLVIMTSAAITHYPIGKMKGFDRADFLSLLDSQSIRYEIRPDYERAC